MAAGVELPEGRSGGIAMEFPVGEEESFSSPTRLPKRLRRRLRDTECKSPSTVEEIEAKLRDADLRRQVCVWLVRKFRVFKVNFEMLFTFFRLVVYFFAPCLLIITTCNLVINNLSSFGTFVFFLNNIYPIHRLVQRVYVVRFILLSWLINLVYLFFRFCFTFKVVSVLLGRDFFSASFVSGGFYFQISHGS